MLQFIFFYDHGCRVRFKDVPDRLLLGKDEPPFRRRGINGDDQNDDIRGIQQIPDKGSLRFFPLCHGGDPFFQFKDPFTGRRAYRAQPVIRQIQPFFYALDRVRPGKFFFIYRNDEWDPLRADPVEKSPVLPGRARRPVDHKHRRIRLIEHLVTPADAQASQFALIIDPRRVHHYHRTKGQKLH